MNIKHIAALATALIASSALAGSPAEKKCSAGTCSKKEAAAEKKDSVCSKKDDAAKASAAVHKDAACSKKDAAGEKKEASCSKK